MKSLKKYFVFLFALSATKAALAFPEMVTHGYANCTACHVSPSGGGVLTEYGRRLSRELLSTWGNKGEENFLHGSVETPKWLATGGDVRAIQTYIDSPAMKKGEAFVMQTEIAAAALLEKWTFLVNLGVRGGPPDAEKLGHAESRIHYVMYRPIDALSLRVGKFTPQYGLYEPNHEIVTRDLIGFSDHTETYNAEASWQGDQFDFFVTSIAGRPDDTDLVLEKGYALSSSINFLDRNKVGLSYFNGKNDQGTRSLGGIWAILGLSEKTFLMAEVDQQWKNPSDGSDSSTGVVRYCRAGYEPIQGLKVYGLYQDSQMDLNDDATKTDSFGPGVDFFPRPHMEIRSEYLRQRVLAYGPDYFASMWLQLHYYF